MLVLDYAIMFVAEYDIMLFLEYKIMLLLGTHTPVKMFCCINLPYSTLFVLSSESGVYICVYFYRIALLRNNNLWSGYSKHFLREDDTFENWQHTILCWNNDILTQTTHKSVLHSILLILPTLWKLSIKQETIFRES